MQTWQTRNLVQSRIVLPTENSLPAVEFEPLNGGVHPRIEQSPANVFVVQLMAGEPHSAVQVYRCYTDQNIGYTSETIIDNFLSIKVNFVAVISVKAI